MAREDEEQIQAHEREQVPYRRRPDLKNFLVVGALIGLVAGALLGWLGPSTASRSLGQEIVLLGAIGAIVGGFLASIAYLFADWRSMRG